MNITLFIIGISLTLITLAGLIFHLAKFVKYRPLGDGEIVKVQGNFSLIFILCNALFSAFCLMTAFGIVMAGSMPLTIPEVILLTFGSLIFGIGLSGLITTFVLYYYRPDLEVGQRKLIHILMFVAIPVLIAGLWMSTDAYAPYLNYPLVNTINFTEGIIFQTNGSGFSVKFYGIVIVLGAAISYFVSDHYFYKKFGKHGILDTLLLVAFPAGIIGARLWYVLVLNQSVNIFDIRDGGMAIQGGALLGIVVGVAFMLIFRKYINVRWAMDIIVPTILLAQVLGRWGNFFNGEVHGDLVNGDLFWFLPRIIYNNMAYSNGVFNGDATQIYLPLFLIEGIINLAGYFIIRYAIGKGLKKWLSLGDLSMSYVIWYGIVRVFLEPLRGATADYYSQSQITAYVMIVVGVLGIVAFRVYDLIRKKKGLPPRNLNTI